MPRIPIRIEPYQSPARKHRHYKNKRDQILRTLGKASYINGSQFAIVWVNARGESETYASGLFQDKLQKWFTDDILADAKQTVKEAMAKRQEAGLSISEDNKENMGNLQDDLRSWDEDEDIDEDMDGDEMQQQPPPQIKLMKQLQAPELRRSLSTPNASGLQNQDHEKQLQQQQITIMTKSQPVSPSNMQCVTVGNTDEVTKFLESRIRLLQQLVCKIVAKTWIKVLEPRKQTRYPYNKGEESKPDWWPALVRHKEPDHLMKQGEELLHECF